MAISMDSLVARELGLTLTVLGSGTSIPSRRRAPAHLVRAGDLALLVDCGSGCTTSLFAAGVSLDRLSGILLTHLHPDHTADLVPLLFALVNPAHPRRVSELPLWGPEGCAAHLEALRSVYGRWIRPEGYDLRVEQLDEGGCIVVGPLTVTAYRVAHTRASLAYRVETDRASLCLSGDSGPCTSLERAARDVDLLLCECSVLEGEEVEGHLTATQVGELAATASVRRVVLTHLYEHIERADPVARVRACYDGAVELAEDGRTYALA